MGSSSRKKEPHTAKEYKGSPELIGDPRAAAIAVERKHRKKYHASIRKAITAPRADQSW